MIHILRFITCEQFSDTWIDCKSKVSTFYVASGLHRKSLGETLAGFGVDSLWIQPLSSNEVCQLRKLINFFIRKGYPAWEMPDRWWNVILSKIPIIYCPACLLIANAICSAALGPIFEWPALWRGSRGGFPSTNPHRLLSPALFCSDHKQKAICAPKGNELIKM